MCQLRGRREKVFTLELRPISAHIFAELQWKHPSSLKGHMTVYTKSHGNARCMWVEEETLIKVLSYTRNLTKRFHETGSGIKCSCNIIEKLLFNRRKSRKETDGDGLNAASEVVAVAINMASRKTIHRWDSLNDFTWEEKTCHISALHWNTVYLPLWIQSFVQTYMGDCDCFAFWWHLTP